MNREEFLRDCWAYYMMLEEKFIHTLDFVALSTDNEAAYSNEYAGLIQMIGAEMDSFFQRILWLCSNRQQEHFSLSFRRNSRFPGCYKPGSPHPHG